MQELVSPQGSKVGTPAAASQDRTVWNASSRVDHGNHPGTFLAQSMCSLGQVRLSFQAGFQVVIASLKHKRDLRQQ